MKSPILLCVAALAGCIDQPEQLGATDQALDSHTRDRVFSLGQGGTVWSRVQTASNQTSFNDFEALGTSPDGNGFTRFATERNRDGRLSVFAVGTDTRLYGRYQTSVGGGWNPDGWGPLGGGFIAQVATAQNADGRIELFALNTQDVGGTVWHRFQVTPNGGWNADGFEQLGTRTFKQISANRQLNGQLEVVGLDPAGQAWHRVQLAPNSGWDADWSPVGVSSVAGAVLSNVTLLNAANNQLHLFALNSLGDVEEAIETSTSTWTTFSVIAHHLGPAITQIVPGVLFDGRITVLAVDATHRGLQLSNLVGSNGGWDGPFFHIVSNWSDVAQLAVAREANLGLTVFARKFSDQSLEAATQVSVRDSNSFNPMVALGGIQSDIVAIDEQ